jgi:formylglycine-generating enzyme required for sulfatase activity
MRSLRVAAVLLIVGGTVQAVWQARPNTLAGGVSLVNEDTPALDLGKGVKMPLLHIKAGSFLMGSPGSDKDAFNQEKPQHEVRIRRDYLLGKYAVTREQFARFVDDEGYQTEAEKDGQGGWGYNAENNKLEGRNPKYSWRDPGFTQDRRHPVVNVSWNDARAFCRWLSRKTGRACDLPTEAQWEYACRAGMTTRYFTGDDRGSLEGYANVGDQTLKEKRIKSRESYPFFAFTDGYPFTSPVEAFKPNRWGLHDMTGNVWQWCVDWYGKGYYASSDKDDPQGPNSGTARVVRAGSWGQSPRDCRAAFRSGLAPSYRNCDVGFRIMARLD